MLRLFSRTIGVVMGGCLPLVAIQPFAQAFAPLELAQVNSALEPLPEQVQAARTSAPTNIAPGYLLGPGDEIAIDVFGYEEYTGIQVVAPDGTVSFPVLGTVEVANQTIETATQSLYQSLNQVLVNPAVTLRLESTRPVMVIVSGEVQRPGPIQLASLTAIAQDRDQENQTVPTLSTAIGKAGGVTRQANIREVVVRRVTDGGQVTDITVDLWSAIWSDESLEDPLLQAGDTVYVPQLTEPNRVDQGLVARSSLAPDTIRVRVVGEVVRPGEVQVPPDSSLSSAVAIAGGPTEDSRLSEVVYVRLDETGTVQRQEVDLRNLTDSYQVQEGDVIMVPKRGSSSVLDFAARLLNPLGSFFRIFDAF
ncbi:MAG: polysaccharide biosynthesis/export family protein [Cyanobacteria bacterium P01_B01_bin.77]